MLPSSQRSVCVSLERPPHICLSLTLLGGYHLSRLPCYCVLDVLSPQSRLNIYRSAASASHMYTLVRGACALLVLKRTSGVPPT